MLDMVVQNKIEGEERNKSGASFPDILLHADHAAEEGPRSSPSSLCVGLAPERYQEKAQKPLIFRSTVIVFAHHTIVWYVATKASQKRGKTNQTQLVPRTLQAPKNNTPRWMEQEGGQWVKGRGILSSRYWHWVPFGSLPFLLRNYVVCMENYSDTFGPCSPIVSLV